MIGTYKATVTPEFIQHRNRQAPKYNAGVFGADAEFPEHHQVTIDEEQILYEKWEYDTYHTGLECSMDYKMHSHSGIHVSPAIQRVITAGKTDKLVIWRWLPEYVELEAGMEVEYEILAIVDAKESIRNLDRHNRFEF